MNSPKEQLLVSAIAVGDVGAEVIGYYHWDVVIKKHYVVTATKCIRYEVIPETVELINAKVINNE